MRTLKLLITSGATREPIDGVRYISNVSTGRTGARLAEFFSELGFSVVYAHGEGAVLPEMPSVELKKFLNFKSLEDLLQEELRTDEYFAVIHLAAVADYSISSLRVGEKTFAPEDVRKLDSGEEIELVLKRNPKLLDQIKKYSTRRSPYVVGFKLTHQATEAERMAAISKQASTGQVDLIVHNDLAQIRQGGPAEHRFEVFGVRNQKAQSKSVCTGTDELGTAIVESFREYL